MRNGTFIIVRSLKFEPPPFYKKVGSLPGTDTYHMSTPLGFTDTTKSVEAFNIMILSDIKDLWGSVNHMYSVAQHCIAQQVT